MRETNAEKALRKAFENAAEKQIGASKSGTVAAEASEAVWMAVARFNQLVESGRDQASATQEAIGDFKGRIASIQQWLATSGDC